MPAAKTDPVSDARKALLTTLDSVEPIVTMSREDLVVIALGSRVGRPGADYLTLADAGQSTRPPTGPAPFEFTELDNGSVPTIHVNVGVTPLVVLAGETIVGGKQNRIINLSLWLAAQKTTPIPVSCLEAGRWDSGRLFAAGRQVDLDLRAKVSRMVGSHARSGQPAFAADQGAVWDEIALKERLAARRSPTAALHELYAAESEELEAFVSAFPVPAGACGLAVAVGGRLVALDLFDSAATLRNQWPRLMASAASASLDHRRRVTAGMVAKAAHRHPDPGALGRMLARAKKGDGRGDPQPVGGRRLGRPTGDDQAPRVGPPPRRPGRSPGPLPRRRLSGTPMRDTPPYLRLPHVVRSCTSKTRFFSRNEAWSTVRRRRPGPGLVVYRCQLL